MNIPSIDHLDLVSDSRLSKDGLSTNRLLKLFWKLIKTKSQLIAEQTHIFCFRRSQRKNALLKLKPN